MHPELLWSLAAERRRDLAAASTATGRSRALTLPRFRVSWTRVTLAAAPGGGRGGSVMIVISATRAG